MTEAPQRRRFQPKNAAIAVVMMLIPLPPALLLGATGLSGGIAVVLLGTFAGLMPALFLSLKRTLIVVLVMSVMNALAAPAAPYVLLAGIVMGVTGLLFGLTARWQVTSVTGMAAISVAFTMAEPSTVVDGAGALSNAVLVGLLALAGGLWGAGVGAALGRGLPTRPPVSPLSWPSVWTYAVMMMVVTGIAMAVVIAMDLAHGGAWLLLTLFIVVQPDATTTWRKSFDRVWGTLLGFVIAFVVALFVDHPAVLTGLGALFLGCSVYVKLDASRRYWEFTTFLTPGIVLLVGAGSDIVDLDLQRLAFTAIGVAVAMLLVVVYRLISHTSPPARS